MVNDIQLGMLRAGLWLQVDASRRRNDPRKATFSRRAWCDLEVSPAVSQAEWRPGREKEEVQGSGDVGPSSGGRRHRLVPSPLRASVGSKTRSAARDISNHFQVSLRCRAIPISPDQGGRNGHHC